MWVNRTAGFLNAISNPLANLLNHIASVALAAMMALTGIDVALRWIFNRPIAGSYEMTEFMMPVLIAFGLAHCAMEYGHVRVDLVILKLPARGQAVMNCIASLVFFALFFLITWGSLLRALGMMDTGQTSEVLYIPVFPFVLTVTLGSAALSLVAFKDFFQSLSEALKE